MVFIPAIGYVREMARFSRINPSGATGEGGQLGAQIDILDI